MTKQGRPAARPKVRLTELIPHGFRCPTCKEPRPNPHQWAVICDGITAMCRVCLSQRRELLFSPLRSVAANMSWDVTNGERYLVIEGGVAVPASAGQCVLGCGRHTRRVEGYCAVCRFVMLRHAHGGYEAYRSWHGRPFIVFEDILHVSGVPKEAHYPWGRERLPMSRSDESTREEWEQVQAGMWGGAEQYLEYAQKIARKAVGTSYGEEVHDAAAEAALKSWVCYEPARAKAMYSTYLYRCVRNAALRAASVEARRKRRVYSLDERAVSAARVEDESEKMRIAREDGNVQDAGALIQALGLTPFERKVLHLQAVEGLSLRAIGFRYGVPATTVHRWIYLAKQKAMRAKERLDSGL